MTGIPQHLSVAGFLAACIWTSTAFKLKYDFKSIDAGNVDVSERLKSISKGRADFIATHVQGSESLNRQAAHSQHSNSQQVNNREVNSKHRQQIRDDSVYYHFRERRFEDSGRRVLRDEHSVHKDGGNKISFSEALSQEVSKSDLPYSVPKMVVVVSTTLAALFGMCVMAAIFQCCCRKKRSSSDSEADGVKSDTNDRKKSKSPSPEKTAGKPDETGEKTENDKLLEDDDLGDFSAVQREQEILKSFRKPPPPKNRQRASRVPRMKAAASSEDAFSLIKEEPEGSIKSKTGSRRNSPEKKVSNESKPEELESSESAKKEEKKISTEAPTTELTEPSKSEDKRLSFEAAKQIVDSMLAEVKEKEERTLAATETDEQAKEKREETGNVNGLSSKGGNIFMQIDPTVKIQDPSEKKASRIPVRATPPSPESPSKPGASLRPTSANKEQRKFLVPSVHGEQMDQLVKSLKTRLKDDKEQTCLSDRNLATNKSAASGSEDLEPVGRERSHSDPTKNLLSVKATHV